MIELKVRYSAGEFLKIMVLEERRLSQKWLAKRLGCAEREISAICKNKRGISARFALQLEDVFGISTEMWVTMQAKWELSQARKNTA